MKILKINDVEYKLRELDEITNGACRRVESLQERLLFHVLDFEEVMKLKTGEEQEADDATLLNLAIEKGLLRTGKTISDVLDAVTITETKKDLMTVMLTTDIDYFELVDGTFPRRVLLTLISESKQLIGSFEDFSNGLQLNIPSPQAPKSSPLSSSHKKAKSSSVT